ncbi:MAG: DUF1735 domain-containing protein [Dysgonamonadaceae bacterium]|jgi:hypothetical protein|nr:DUF1735 domain-containing protein [Dysgonamonadaceae bacterium]
MMRNIIIIFLTATSLITALGGCSSDTDFGEQYKKTLFIVNATTFTGDHAFDNAADEIIISVYCSSTEPIKSDLTARLMLDPAILDSINYVNTLSDESYINRVMLPTANYSLPEFPTVTIKAGEQYGTLRIPFNSNGLDPDIFYALPLYLSANDKGYEMNDDLRMMFYQVNMVNDFSGSYNGTSSELPASETERIVIKTVQPTLKAMSANIVRMSIHDATSATENLMQLEIGSDNSVRILPWNGSNVLDLGDSRYNPVTMQFELNYRYNGKVISEIITNILAPKTDEDEFN